MDSLSQICLGAGVATLVMGNKVPLKHALLWGAVAGTLPDLDVLFGAGDAITKMVSHRGNSHALLYLALLSPLFAWLISAIHRQRLLFPRWWLAISLVLITHPLLDVMTIYGTRLGLPFTNTPFGIGSIFIIDPLYTLPLVITLVVAFLRPNWCSRAAACGLGLSSLYLIWSLGAQQYITAQVNAKLPAPAPTGILVTPTPFNTLLWRVLIMNENGYYEGFYNVLSQDTAIDYQFFAQDTDLREHYADHPDISRIASFSHGFYSLTPQDDKLILTDLRMGLRQNYAFNFEVTPDASAPPLALPRAYDMTATLRWMQQKLAAAH
ncbi:metal-dependent hydrolase [Arsukibacterium sp. UBA3155]|mgnify:CR=1 FL=1|uniref:metal-dependent hydrolase n=1 Tax=Arsukibacterium sp. UBA3155 TaxID=1946058 RepID=UPI0025BC4E38|nr:metal-dependent hydrolase [Arsukibacterium sp. UBA3155]|tara:strand:- start:84066 stop:85034 length:969 start_codon:yes stop_codon:yes gene_type:complete